jgi:hypothetical protein
VARAPRQHPWKEVFLHLDAEGEEQSCRRRAQHRSTRGCGRATTRKKKARELFF